MQQQQLVCSSFYRLAASNAVIVKISMIPNKLNDLTIVKHLLLFEVP